MAKHRRKIDSNGPNAEATSDNTVFVDTGLDTHLVMIISSSDTVSDFKRKLLFQHYECFPRIGGIKIHSLQVKRLGHFYHLPDSMLVSSAFDGSKRTWFLFVEASCSQGDDKEQLSCKPDDATENVSLLYLQHHSQGDQHNLLADDPLKLASEKVPQASPRNFSGEILRDIEMEVGNFQGDCQKELSSDINENLALRGSTLGKNVRVSENAASAEDDNSRDHNKTAVSSSLDELPFPAKKRKIKDIENVGLTVKKKRKVESKKDPSVDASVKVPSDMQTRQTDLRGEPYDTNWMSISGAQRTSKSEPNTGKSDQFGGEEVYRDGSNSTTKEQVSKQEKMASSQEAKEDDLVTGMGGKKGKKKQKETLFVPHDQEREAPEANKNEGHAELVHNNDPEVMLSNQCKPLDQGEADGTNKESIPSPNFVGYSSPTVAVDSVRTRKKKRRAKKKAPGLDAYSTGEGTNIAGEVSSTVADLAPKDHINDKIRNDESDQNYRNEKGLLHNDDPQAQPSESFKPSDQVEAQEMNKGSNLSPNLSGAKEVAEVGNSGTIKRKRRNAKKSAAELQDKSVVENLHETSLPVQAIAFGVEMNNETTMENKTVHHTEKELENDKELPSRHRPEVVLTKGIKPLNSGKATVNDEEPGFAETSLDDKHGLEAGKSGVSCKKKKMKKPPTTNDDFSSMEHSNPVNVSPTKHFEGDGGLSSKHGPGVISSKGSKTLDLGEVTVNTSELGFAAQRLDDEDDLKAVKSCGGKKKKGKKNATSVCHSPAKHFASEVQGNQSILSCTEEKETSKEGSRNASNSGACKGSVASKSKEIVSPLGETDQTRENTKDLDDNLRETKIDQSMDTNALQDRSVKVQANEVEHLQQDEADKEKEYEVNIKKNVKRKTKKNQKIAAETESNSKTKGQSIGIEELAASSDKLGNGDHPYDTTNTSVPDEKRTGNPSAEKNVGVKSKLSNPEQALKGADSSEVPSHHTLENKTMTDIEDIVETSKAGDEGINFRHYFVPEEHQSEDTTADKVKEALHSTEDKRKAKKPIVVSEGSLRSNQQRQNKSNTYDNQLEESSPDAKENKDMPWTNKETSKASGNVVNASKSHDVDKVKTPRKATKPVVANGSWLEENNGSVTAASSSSSAKGSKRALRDTSNTNQQSGFNNDGISARKTSRKNDGDIVNCSQYRKSLFSSAGTIFSDGSSGSSGNENGVENSDASTRTPSESSSSSGYSVGESELSRDLKGNGSENRGRKDLGCKSTSISKFPDPKDLSMDMILRSSKRFKKAKLTASQSQEADTESQPVDFILDSQAN